MLLQLPTLPAGEFETWLLCAMGAILIAVAVKSLGRKQPLEAGFVTKEEFRIFRQAIERDLGGLRDRIDSRYLSVVEAIDKLRVDLLADAERRAANLHQRLNDVESGLERVDERTRSS